MPYFNCEVCKKQKNISYAKNASNRFCYKKCEFDNKRNETYDRFIKGTLKDRGTVRNVLLSKRPECWSCGIKNWKGQHLSLEIDHIDGNAGNHTPSNVRLLCPNCHAITPNWKARNKGKGRASRGLKLY